MSDTNTWPKYREMTPEQMAQWGAAESAARIEDLKNRTEAGLTIAKLNAEARRKLIGASMGQAASMVAEFQRAQRRARATGSQA